MVGKLKKAYLHRPIKILYFLTPVRIQEILTYDKMITFKNNAPIRSCISKTNNTFIDNAEDLDIFMSMYNFSEYSDNYSMTWGSLRNYFKDEVNNDANENNADNYSTDNSKSALSQVNILNM